MSKKLKTTHEDVSKKRCTQKDVLSLNYVSAIGTSYVTLVCPFCSDQVKAYVWSYTSVGKRCDCGALLVGKKAFMKNQEGVANA